MATKRHFLSNLCYACETITSTLDYDEALRSLVRNAAKCLKAKACSLRLLDRSGNRLEIVATFGLSQAYLKKGPVEIAKSPIDKAVLAGKVVQIKDVTRNKRFQYPEEAKKEGIKSVLCIPLKCKRSLIGVVRIYSGKERKFTDEDIAFMRTLASQGAAVIRNAKRYGRLKSLSQIGKNIASQLDIQKVLDTICQNAATDMQAKGASIMLVNRDTGELQLVATFGLSEAFIHKGIVEADKSISESLKGKEVVIKDATRDSRVQYPNELKKEGIKSIICIPLKLKDKIIGTLRIYTAYRYELYDEDLEFLNILGDFGVVALENARLYEHVSKEYEDLTRDVWKWYGWGEKQPKI